MPRGIALPRLRALREAAFLTQEELAQRAGVSRKVIVNAEQGANVRVSSARKIADALEVKPSELVRQSTEE